MRPTRSGSRLRVRACAVVVLAGSLLAACSSGHHAAAAPRTVPPAQFDKFACTTPPAGAVTAYNSDGSTRWERPTSAGEDPAAVLTDGTDVFAGAGGTVLALRGTDGTVAWQQHLGSTVYALWLYGGKLVANIDQVSTHARIMALDPRTGAVRWSYAVPGRGFLGDAALTSDGGLALVVPSPRALTVLDLASGRVRWSVSTDIDTNSYPTAGDGLVIGIGSDQNVVARDSRTGTVRWQQHEAGSVMTSEVLVHDGVGVAVPNEVGPPGTSVATAYSLRTGDLLWQHTFGYIPAVQPAPSGFLLPDEFRRSMSLVDDHGRAAWTVHLPGVTDINPAALTGDRRELAAVGQNIVDFVDMRSGQVKSVNVTGALQVATAPGTDVYVTTQSSISLVSRTGVVWHAALPELPIGSQPVLVLPGGSAVIHTADPMCAEGALTSQVAH